MNVISENPPAVEGLSFGQQSTVHSRRLLSSLPDL